jgi:hypothetical protein
MQKYTDKQVVAALEKSLGVVSHAASALGTGRSTLSGRIERNPHLQGKLDDIREGWVDIAESKLMELIEKGQPAAIIFYLKCQAKDRGYVERQEVTGRDGQGTAILPIIGPPRASSMEEWLEQNRQEAAAIKVVPKPLSSPE